MELSISKETRELRSKIERIKSQIREQRPYLKKGGMVSRMMTLKSITSDERRIRAYEETLASRKSTS